MRNEFNSIAENNRGSIALASKYARFTMQTEADGVATMIDSSPDDIFGSPLTLTGTTTDIFDPLTGVLTFHAAGNPHVVNTTDTSVANLFDMSQNSAGGYLLMFRYQTTLTVPTAAEYLFSAGHHASANGGFQIRIDTNGNVIAIILDVSGAQSKFVVGSTNICDDSVHTALVYFDAANFSTHVYVDGSIDVAETAWGFTGLPTITPSRNVGLFCRAASATSGAELMGEFDAGPLLSNFWIIRAETDISASLPAIATEYHANPSKMLWALDGL